MKYQPQWRPVSCQNLSGNLSTITLVLTCQRIRENDMETPGEAGTSRGLQIPLLKMSKAGLGFIKKESPLHVDSFPLLIMTVSLWRCGEPIPYTRENNSLTWLQPYHPSGHNAADVTHVKCFVKQKLTLMLPLKALEFSRWPPQAH